MISTTAACRAPELSRHRFLELCRTPISLAFERHRWANSITLMVAQYWNDEAEDAVHPLWVFSTRAIPDLDAYELELARNERFDTTPDARPASVNLPEHVHGWDLHAELAHGFSRTDHTRIDIRIAVPWDSNGWAIPLFAAYCPEGGSQESSMMECYRPVTVFRRPSPEETHPVIEFTGNKLRPWLDGVYADENE
jgi:hypothetical protein